MTRRNAIKGGVAALFSAALPRIVAMPPEPIMRLYCWLGAAAEGMIR